MKQGYGTYSPGGTFTPPLHEEMVNDLPVDYAKTVVYTEHRKLLDAASKGKNWTWCEVCPDAIVTLLQLLSGLTNMYQDWFHAERLSVQFITTLGPVSVSVGL
jgi:hypothetical protein